MEFWNDNGGKKQYILMFECVTEETAEEVAELLKTGAAEAFLGASKKRKHDAKGQRGCALHRKRRKIS